MKGETRGREEAEVQLGVTTEALERAAKEAKLREDRGGPK